MESIFRKIKEIREQNQWTQFQLAQKSGLSLATIQNIESQRANPEVSTLSKILHALDYSLSLEPQRDMGEVAYWINYGLPLMQQIGVRLPQPKREDFISDYVKLDPRRIQTSDGRVMKSWVHFLIALRDHFPSVFKLNPEVVTWIKKHQDTYLSPKLRRICIHRFSEFM
jgi:transcriptional regulator with XRE-family HTH domain